MKKQMNERVATRILPYPLHNTLGDEGIDKPDERPERFTWIRRQLVALGVLMAPSTTQQMPINFQKLSFFLGVVLAVLGGFWWSYQRGEDAGRVAERQAVMMEVMKAEQRDKDAAMQKEIDKLKERLQLKKDLESVGGQ